NRRRYARRSAESRSGNGQIPTTPTIVRQRARRRIPPQPVPRQAPEYALRQTSSNPLPPEYLQPGGLIFALAAFAPHSRRVFVSTSSCAVRQRLDARSRLLGAQQHGTARRAHTLFDRFLFRR